MRVAIDILSAALGGPGQYFRRLLPHLCRRAAGDELHVLAAHPGLIRELPSAAGLTIHDIPAGRQVGRRLIWQRRQMPAWLRERRIDVVFTPQGLTALRDETPLVVLHQDAMYLTRERFGRSRIYHALQQRLARRTLERAAMALYVSRAIRDLAADRGWLRAEASRVIPHGVDVEELRASADAAPPPPEAEGRPYLLTVGSVMPHKNVAALVDAVALLRRRGRDDLRLLIVGEAPEDRPCVQALRRQIAESGLSQAVRIVGHRSRPALGPYYRHARLYVTLSLLESGPLTPIEAMGMGIPVLCHRLPAFEETCGDDAAYVDGTKAAAAADAIASLWDDSQQRDAFIRRGAARCGRFQWSAVADAIHAALKDVARIPR